MRIPKVLATSLGALVLALAPAAALTASAATPGYHASYFSESSFLSLAPGAERPARGRVREHG